MYLGYPTPTVNSVRNETTTEASNNQTTFFPNGGYYPGYIDVYVDGIKKVESVDYTASDGFSVVFSNTIANGALVQLVSIGVVPISSVVSRTGDTMTGSLTVPNLTVTQNTVTNVVTASALSIGQNTVVNNHLTVTGNTTQSGDFSITGNINLTGSLIITGAATSVTTESLAVEDTIITLGANNTSGDTLDIGFAGQYNNGSSNVWSGIVRNATDKIFYAFEDYDEAPGNDIDLLDPSFKIAEFRANFNGNLVSNSVTASIVNAGNVNLTSSIRLTGDATGYTQLSTSIYGGDAAAGQGRFEYHANAWILNAGSDSANIALFQRGNLVKSFIDNDGTYHVGNSTVNATAVSADSLVVKTTVSANGTVGTAGYVLTSAGSGANAYWAVAAGGGGNAYGTVAVSGQSNLVADNTNTVITFASGNNLVITTNTTTQTVTFATNTTPTFGNTTIDGFANVTSTLQVSANVTLGSTTINANGSVGSAGQVLTSGSSGNVYWSTISGATNLAATTNSTAVVVTSDTGTDATIESANSTVAGVLTAADKSKLDGIASGAQPGTVTSIETANGLSGGTITTTGTISLSLQDGLFSNTTGVYVNASAISVGTVPTAILGSGTANSTTYLAGDQTWQSISGGGGGIQTNDHAQLSSLGVGTTAPGSGANGEIRATGNVVAYYSDARLKDFEGVITEALNKVEQINGYYFRENELAKQLGYNTDSRQVGVSAQEIQAILPEIVLPAPIDSNYLTVKYELLVPLLIQAIKELKIEVDNLKNTRNS